jgi:hypothetical protein
MEVRKSIAPESSAKSLTVYAFCERLQSLSRAAHKQGAPNHKRRPANKRLSAHPKSEPGSTIESKKAETQPIKLFTKKTLEPTCCA